MLLGIRVGFDQYVNLRPIRLYPGVPTPIQTATPKTVDFVVVRENTEGEYSRQGGLFHPGAPTASPCRPGSSPARAAPGLIRYAFELARQRKASATPGG